MTANDPTPDDKNEDDDMELELEPVDPEILKHARQRTIRQTRKAEDAVDINKVYRADEDDPFEFDDIKKFRFTIRHMLLATAMLSIVMTIYTWTSACNAIAIAFFATVAGGWWIVIRKERQQALEIQRQQLARKARIATQRAAEDSESGTAAPLPEEMHFDPPPEPKPFRIAFSVKQMFGAFTVAAVLLGLISTLGGPGNTAILLGSIALLGLAMNAVGFDPPEVIVLSWWLLLVMYLIVSLMAAFSSSLAAMVTPSFPFDTLFALWVG